MKFCIRFKDGLEKILDYPCPRDKHGNEYIPHEFKTGRPDRIENVIVRSDPNRTHRRVYDRDGKRVYMEEARLPPFVDAAGATKWVEMACQSLKKDLSPGASLPKHQPPP